MITTVDSTGRIFLPTELCYLDDVDPRPRFEIERVACGEYRLVRQLPQKTEGLVDWLLAYPEKGFLCQLNWDRRTRSEMFVAAHEFWDASDR